jgi:hypothetical protein
LDVEKLSLKVDILGIMLHVGTGCVILVSPIAPLMVWMEHDPMSYFFPTTGKPMNVQNLTFRFFKISVQSFLIYDALRKIIFVVSHFIVSLKITGFNYKILLEKSETAPLGKLYKLYKRLYLFTTIGGGEIIPPIIFCFMGAGLFFEVFALVITIRFFSVPSEHLPIYILFPLLSVFIPLIAHILLPDAIENGTDSEEMLRNCRLRLPYHWNKKLLRKKADCLRPFRYYAGLGQYKFFPVIESTKSTYYTIMIGYAIDALLSVPEEVVLRAVKNF